MSGCGTAAGVIPWRDDNLRNFCLYFLLTGLWDNSEVVGAKDFVSSGKGQEQYSDFFLPSKTETT